MQQIKPNGSTLTRLKSCIALILLSGLAGCGGGGSSGTSAGADTNGTFDATAQSVSLSGSVGDGPIVGATVTIKDARGKILSSSVSDANANYTIAAKVPGNAYPITLEATGGIDIVTNTLPDFMLISAALSPSSKRANLNPYTTLVIQTARNMPGGLTSSNVGRANQVILNQLNFGLDTSSMPDPIATPVTGSNVAVIVKASETFGEMIRRTRDTLMVQGTYVSGDDVINALASDLIDGVVDGIGGSLADPRVAALSSLTGAQVLIEAMSNTLKVYGADATQAMDDAIKQIMPDAPADAVTANVLVTAQALTQARTSIKAAQALAPSTALTTITKMLEAIQPGATAADVAKIMPADTSTDLNSVILSAAVATTDQLATVNTIVGMQYGGTYTAQTTPPAATSTETNTDTTTDTTTGTNTDAGSGGTSGIIITNSLPVARDDSVSTTLGTSVTINVLANDSGLEDTPVTVSVISGPANGSVSVKSDNTIVYSPKSGFYGSDSFTYRVTDANGDMATAAVSISVTCTTCTVQSNVTVTLTWDPTPGEVLGYRVFYGNTATNATTFASVTSTNSVSYLSSDDLNLKSGDQLCFRVKAYNSAGESAYSSAVCKVI